MSPVAVYYSIRHTWELLAVSLIEGSLGHLFIYLFYKFLLIFFKQEAYALNCK